MPNIIKILYRLFETNTNISYKTKLTFDVIGNVEFGHALLKNLFFDLEGIVFFFKNSLENIFQFQTDYRGKKGCIFEFV